MQTKKPRRAMPSPAQGENEMAAANNSSASYTMAANGGQSKTIKT